MASGLEQLARWGALCALVAMGCQVGPGPVAPEPREHVKVRLGLLLLSDGVREPILAGLRRDPSVAAVEELRGELTWEERALCGGHDCQLTPKLCAWANERGLDFTVVAMLTDGERASYGPGQTSFPDEHLHSQTSLGRLQSYSAWARLVFAIYETRTCHERPDLFRRLEASSSTPPSRGGGPEAERREVLAATPAFLADTFPALLRVGSHGEIRGLLRDVPAPPGLYHVFDERRFVGTVSLPEGESPPGSVQRLTCCFAIRPGETLVRARTDYLFELAPSFSSATAIFEGQARAALGFGLHVRYRTTDAGWQGGAAFDFLHPSGATFFLGALEGGYQWRPAPTWALGFFVDAGGGVASTPLTIEAKSRDRAGAHAAAMLMASFQPGRVWFAGLDLGYIQSLPYASAGGDNGRLLLQGPLLRLTAGLR